MKEGEGCQWALPRAGRSFSFGSRKYMEETFFWEGSCAPYLSMADSE